MCAQRTTAGPAKVFSKRESEAKAARPRLAHADAALDARSRAKVRGKKTCPEGMQAQGPSGAYPCIIRQMGESSTVLGDQ